MTRVVNTCMRCHAVREYPSNLKISTCPRCGARDIAHYERDSSTDDETLLRAIKGSAALEE